MNHAVTEFDRIGIISDAHGNPFGLQVCIKKLHSLGVTKIFFLGDAVGYLPLEQEVLSILKEEDIYCILGNHEAMLCGLLALEPNHDSIYGLRSATQRLGSHKIAEIAAWPRKIQMETAQGSLLFVHGSPWNELTEYVYEDRKLESFGKLGFRAIFMGHTHRPFCRQVDNVIVSNVGSCGLPRDIGNMASCAIYDIHRHTVKILRFNFDVDKLLAKAQQVTPIPNVVVKCLNRTGDV